MNQNAVMEVVRLQIKPDATAEFEAAMKEAIQYLQKTPGHLDQTLHRCIEEENRYLLLIYWESLDAHLVNFRQSDNYVQWRAVLSSFFVETPQVLHYRHLDLKA